MTTKKTSSLHCDLNFQQLNNSHYTVHSRKYKITLQKRKSIKCSWKKLHVKTSFIKNTCKCTFYALFINILIQPLKIFQLINSYHNTRVFSSLTVQLRRCLNAANFHVHVNPKSAQIRSISKGWVRESQLWMQTLLGEEWPHQEHFYWLIEHGFTSAPTQYRLYGQRFLQVWWPNQQCQSTEGGW